MIAWITIGVLLAASAFFSASETALFSLDAAGRDRAGPGARKLLANPQGLLISLLLANLLVNVLVFAVASSLVGEGHEGLEELVAGALALLAVLVIGEILPKSLALRAPVVFARFVAAPVAVLVALLAPLRRLVRFQLDLATRVLGDVAREEPRITAETLAEVLGQSAEVGMIAAGEADLLAEVVELEGIRVREIMTPRVDMLSLDLEASEDDNIQIMARALARRLTWLPVVRAHADQVVGSVRMRDLLAQPERALRELVRPAHFVPEVAGVLDLLRHLREKRATEAVVVDEWGGTAGVVTIENVFEEIVGDLRVEGEPLERPVVPLEDGRFRVSGSLSIRDWNERFNHEVVPEGFETVGGFVTALLGRIPRAGDRVRQGDLVWQVREVRGRRVTSVDLHLEPKGEAAASGGAALISWLDLAVLAAGVLATAAYSGSETAFYCVSRARIDVEARQGVARSKLVRKLLADDMAFLIVVLIGNALMVELMTWSAEDLFRAQGLPPWAVRAALAVVLTPFLFFFCEVLPKDLFRRRPHAFLSWTAPFVLASRIVFWPLERFLFLLTYLLDRVLRLEPRLLSVVRGRESVLRLLSEGAREGAILPHAEQMARNVLKLRTIEVERCMIPWANVRTLRADAPQAELYEQVAQSPHTRIPVVDAQGAVQGYVHQLDVLGEGEDVPVQDQLRQATQLASGTSVDRALAKLRSAGQRLAIVGEAASPRGLVTLKDLLEEISGDLAGW